MKHIKKIVLLVALFGLFSCSSDNNEVKEAKNIEYIEKSDEIVKNEVSKLEELESRINAEPLSGKAVTSQEQKQLNDILEASKEKVEKLKEMNEKAKELLPDVERIWKISGYDGFIKYDCTSFSSEKFINICFTRKLQDLYNFRLMSEFKDVSCGDRYKTSKFPGFEKEAKEAFWLCVEERKKTKESLELQKEEMLKQEEINKDLVKKVESLSISDCKALVEGKNIDSKEIENEINKCEISVALKSEEWCTVFTDESKLKECNQVKSDMEAYERTKSNFESYSNFDLKELVK